MSTGFENDPEFNDISPKPKPGCTLTLGKLLLGVAIIAVLIALLLPATRSAKPAARRAQCSNNLKQILLALHNYQQDYEAFPPAYTVDANGRPLHSWRTLILPYLEQKAIYDTIDLSKPWNDTVNAAAFATKLTAFTCPAAADETNTTAYLAIVGPDGFLVPGRSRRLEEITDGLPTTLALIEASEDDAVPWMAPFDADAVTVLKLDTKAKLSHAGGTNAAFADGSVRFMKADTPAPVWRALLSIAGNDNDVLNAWAW
jgi:prepilin-type processing-associated H-X9-DG protein